MIKVRLRLRLKSHYSQSVSVTLEEGVTMLINSGTPLASVRSDIYVFVSTVAKGV